MQLRQVGSPFTAGHVRLILESLQRKPQLLEEIPPYTFWAVVSFLLTKRGYQILGWSELGEHPGTLLVQVVDPMGSRTLGIVCLSQSGPDKKISKAELGRYIDLYTAREAGWLMYITTSLFTEGARSLGHQWALSYQPTNIIDRNALLKWIDLACQEQEDKAGSLAYRIKGLSLRNFSAVSLPYGSPVDAPREILTTLHLPGEYAQRVLTVSQLPLRLFEAVMAHPQSLHSLTPRQFEEFIAEILHGIGFVDLLLTPKSGDGGRDIIASKKVHNIPLTFYFECKKFAEGRKVQLDTLRSLLGVVAHHSSAANIGVLVTTSTFTQGCAELIASECRLDGKDYNGIMGWVKEFTETFPGGVHSSMLQ